MPTYQTYERLPDGRVKLTDADGGALTLLPSPSVDQQIAQIDAQRTATPAPVPDGIVAAESPKLSDTRAFIPVPTPPAAPAPEAAPAGLAQASPLVGVAPAPAPPVAPAAAPAPAPAAAPGEPPKIVRGGQPVASQTPGSVAANLYAQAAERELTGSPGTFVPGGTFKTGATQQYSPGPDPMATLAREAAEKRLANVRSDLAYLEGNAATQRAELAEAEAQRAAARQAEIEQLQARQAEKLGGVLGEIDQKRKEIADAKLDPNRLLRNMSTGQQALAGLAMVFSGLGKALAGGDGPPMAFAVLDEALKTDLQMQQLAVEQKRGEINTLGEIYKLTKEQFGDERMAMDAAYLAGLETYKAKIARTAAEAEAAMGVETQYDENGQIVPSSPYSVRAREALALLEAEQARLREQLSQAANGQVAQQYQTTQDKVVGGRAPNLTKAAELLEKAEKAGGAGGQQVTYEGKKYRLGSFVEDGEGKTIRKEIGDIEVLKKDISLLEKELRDHPVDSKTFNKSKVKGLMERVSSKANVVLGQGAKNNDEAARWETILGGVLTNGVGAVQDMFRWADDQARAKLDQVNATPATAASPVRVGARAQAAAEGRALPGGGGVVGAPRAAPPAPVVRASGVRATPLDRAGASLVTATQATDPVARGKAVGVAKAAIRDSVNARQLGPREASVAMQLAEAGDIDGLLSFLSRMRGIDSVRPSEESFQRQVSASLLRRELERAGAATDAALRSGPAVASVTTKVKGGAPTIKPIKPVNLSGKAK